MPHAGDRAKNHRFTARWRIPADHVARHIEEDTAPPIAEDAVNLPGVQLMLEPIRDYPTGALTSHIIGYMGHLPKDNLQDYLERDDNPTTRWA